MGWQRAQQKRKRFIRWLLLAALSGGCLFYLLNQEPALAQSSMKLRDFDWSRVNDTVMGGRSSSSLDWQRDDTLLWRGNLSLQNNGGFVSIRSDAGWADWSGYDGIEVILEASGREVEVTMQRRDVRVRAGGYYAAVPTNATGETRVFIPFEAFQLRSFGQPVRGPTLKDGLDSAGGMGMMIADKQEGSFQVVVKSMRPMRHGPKTRLAKEVKPSIVAAIERGVPVFNKGDAQGCADIYRDTLEMLMLEGAFGEKTWAAQMVNQALKKAKTQASFEAAWTLRWTMDRMMLGL